MGHAPDDLLAEPNEPKTSSAFFSILTNIEYVFTTYGWLVIGGIAVLFHFKEKFLLQFLAHFDKLYGNSAASVEPHMDAQTFFAHQDAMEAARRRMQEAYVAKAAEFAAKQKEEEGAKRQEMLQDWEKHEKGLGKRSKVKPKKETTTEHALKAKPLKPKLRPSRLKLRNKANVQGKRL